MYQVDVYTDARDRTPLEEWLETLDSDAVKKIMHAVEMLQREGTRIARDVEDGIWELRPSRYRVFFFHAGAGRYILLHGYTKKSPKAPRREIEAAKRERADWLEREQHHGS